MWFITNIAKWIIKYWSKINNQLNDIDKEATNKLTKSTSIFDMQRQEILRAAEEKKRKLLEEQQAEKERRERELEEARLEEERKKKEKEEKEKKERESIKTEDEAEEQEQTSAQVWDWTVAPMITVEYESQEPSEKTRREKKKEAQEELEKKYAEETQQTLQSIKQGWKDIYEQTKERYSDWWHPFDNLTTAVQLGVKITADELKLLGAGILKNPSFVISPTKRLREEYEANKYWDWINKNKQLLHETKEDLIEQSKAEKQIESIWGDIESDYDWYESLYNSTQEKSEQMESLDQAIQLAKDTWASEEAISDLEAKKEKLRLEYYRDFYEYTFGQKFEWETLKDLLLNVQSTAKTDKKYTLTQLENLDVHEYSMKVDKVNNWIQQIETIRTNFEIRGNYNVAQLPVDATIMTLENEYGLVLTDKQRDMIAKPYADVEETLQNYDARIKAAKDNWDMATVQKLEEEKWWYKQWMSYFSEFLEYGDNEIAKKNANKYDMADLIFRLHSSWEANDLKNFLTDPELYRSCLKEDWTIDYQKLGNKIEKSNYTQFFWALAWWYKQTAKRQFFQDIKDESPLYGWIRLWAFDKINNAKLYNWIPGMWPQGGWRYLLWWYEKAILNYLDDGGSIDWMTWEWEQEWNDEFINELLWSNNYTFDLIPEKKKKEIATQMAKLYLWNDFMDAFIQSDVDVAMSQWDVITDPIIQQIKNEDALYAQNFWKQFGYWLERIADTFQAYPWDTVSTAAAVMVPFAWWADRIAAWLKMLPWLEKINWWTTIAKMWSQIVWEAIEWELINIMLDSTTYWDPQPIWNLLDVGVWALKWAKYIRELNSFSAFTKVMKNDSEWVLSELKRITWSHESAPKLSDLTNWEKEDLNNAFKKEWIWTVVNKEFTDYLDDDLNVNLEDIYRDFTTEAPRYLWSTEWNTLQALREKVVDKAYADEILSWSKTADADKLKKNRKLIDALYRKAVNSIKDKALINQLLRWNAKLKLNWKQNVIHHWITQQTNTLSKIWKAKMWVNIANFIEQSSKWAFKAINEEMDTVLASIKKMQDAAPEEMKAAFENLYERAAELYTYKKMLPLYLSDKQIDAALKLDKVKTDEFKQLISDILIRQNSDSIAGELNRLQDMIKSAAEWWEVPIDQQIIDAWVSGDKELFSRLVLWNKEVAKEMWINVYTTKEYTDAIKNISDKTLNKSQKNKLNQLLKILDWVNNKTLNIIDLPENIKDIVIDIQWFMWYTKEWDNSVIAIASTLVWWVENDWFNYIKVLSHELWHLIFWSLSKTVKSQLALWLISLLDWKKMTKTLLKKIVPDLPDERIKALKEIYDKWEKSWDLTEFVNELCADTISYSLKNAINWTTDSITKNWDLIINQLKKWKKVKMSWWDNVSDALWIKFVDMLEALYRWISGKTWVEEFQSIMNYVAASIIEWKEISIKWLRSKNFKNIQESAWVLWRKDAFHSYNEVKDYYPEAWMPTYKGMTLSEFDDEVWAKSLMDWYIDPYDNAMSEVLHIMQQHWVSFDDAKELLIKRMEYSNELPHWYTVDDVKKLSWKDVKFSGIDNFPKWSLSLVWVDPDVKLWVWDPIWDLRRKKVTNSLEYHPYNHKNIKSKMWKIDVYWYYWENAYKPDSKPNELYMVFSPDRKINNESIVIWSYPWATWEDLRDSSNNIIHGMIYHLRRYQENLPAFKQFFEGSKIVNKNWEPLMALHWTYSWDFPVFEKSDWKTTRNFWVLGNWTYFTTTPREWLRYASKNWENYPWIWWDLDSYYLNIKNPYILNLDTTNKNLTYADWIVKFYNSLITDLWFEPAERWIKMWDNISELADLIWKKELSNAVSDFLRSKWYDWIWVKNFSSREFGAGEHFDEIVTLWPSRRQIKSMTNNVWTFDPELWIYEYRESSKQKEIAKADYWFQKNYWEELATLDKNITTFDVAKVYSTTIMRDMLQDPSISYKQLWMMMSNKWMEDDIARADILKYASEKDKKKYFKAVEFAQERQRVVANMLMKFWKDWELDLRTQIDWYTFADVLNNVAVKITRNWAVEFAWWDLMKFLNASDKEVYQEQFYNFVKELIVEYNDEVVTKVKDKLFEAWIRWSELWEKYADDDFAAMWVVFSNKIEDSIKAKAVAGGIEETQADLLAKDVVSRMFVGSFYQISNIYRIWDFVPERLVDDFAYWLVLKNKWQAMWDHYTTLYDIICSQYKVANLDERFAVRVVDASTVDMSDVLKQSWGNQFRKLHYQKDVYNRLAARNQEFITLSLKKLWLEKWTINIDKKNWIAFINKIFAKQSQAKTLIWDKIIAKWLNDQILWIGNKLDSVASTDEIADIYIDALSNEKNVELTRLISDDDRKELISELEKIKKDWFSDKDYEDLYSAIQWEYMLNWRESQKLDDYFVGVLTKDNIDELNNTIAEYTRSQVDSMPTEWSDDFKETFKWIDKYLNKPEVKKTIDDITKKINDWNNTVDEWRAEWFIPILDYALSDKTLEAFFDIKDKWALHNFKVKLTNSSQQWARKLIFDMTETSNIWKAEWFKKLLYSFINLTSVSANEKEIWRLTTKWIDFVNWKTVYVWEWPFKEFFDAIWFVPERKFIGIENVINQIIKTLEENIRNWMKFQDFANEVVERYSNRFKNISWTSVINRRKIFTPDEMLNAWDSYFKWWYSPKTVEEAAQYDAAINAYVEILAKRHWEMWWLSKWDLNKIMTKINEWAEQSILVAQWSKQAQEASKLLWLKWYWLWLSANEIEKAEKFAELWHPEMFKNFLYNVYTKTSATYGAKDMFIKWWRKWENLWANAMYTLYYNVLWAWIGTASQQVMTNALEIMSKTLWEFADIEIDPKTFNEVMNLVGDLIPSEIMKSSRAELDIYNIWNWLKNLINRSNALSYADKATEKMVMQYALTASLIDMWFNSRSTKELVSSLMARMTDLNENVLNKIPESSRKLNIFNKEHIIITDSQKLQKELNKQLKRLKDAWTITDLQAAQISKSIREMNEEAEPLREAAKNANYKKNAFYQISQDPAITQNVIWGWAWPANMRFLNWASRKAWEYTYNIANAIRKWDKQALYQYATWLLYRWLLATKIYAQLDKATSNTWWTNYIEFMKMMVLPYAAFNMAFSSALDILEDTLNTAVEGWTWKDVSGTLLNWLFWTFDNLKWRISSVPLFWIWKISEIWNWSKMLSENQSASDYFSWPAASVPIVNYIFEVLWKVFTNRLTRTTTLKSWWLFKNDITLTTPDIFINLLAWWTVTNNTVELKKFINDVNSDIYSSDEGWDFAIKILNWSKDTRYAYMALNKYLYDKWLDIWVTPGTQLWDTLNEFDRLYNEKSFLKSLASLWLDTETFQEMLVQDYTNEWSWTDIAWYEHLKKIWANTPWADAILNLALLKNATMYWFLEAWKWISLEYRNNFIKNNDKIYKEILAEVEEREKNNPKSLKDASYNQDAIQAMIAKYWNQYWEECLVADTIKALTSSYRTQLRKDLKNWATWVKYYKMKYWIDGAETFEWEWKKVTLDEYVALATAKYKNELVLQYYDVLNAWNQFIGNKMMFSHAGMKEDYPLSSELSLNSSLWTALDVDWLKVNIERQWLPALWVNWVLPEYTVKVINSKNIDMTQKLEYVDRVLAMAKLQWPIVEDWIKSWISYPMLDHFVEILNTEEWKEWVEKNASWLAQKMRQYTVSRPLSNEDIKEQVRSSIFKETKSWSGSKSSGRKWSISFKPLADQLTKFQSFKRQLEQNVMWETPLSRIAYKPTSNWVTPIHLSVWEAQEIDKKYTFIKPKQPESEKTPDVVVKQVKTSKSTYSGKSIKQSNVYKVKRVI